MRFKQAPDVVLKHWNLMRGWILLN